MLEALTADRPAFRLQTSDWAREFNGTKFSDLDGSAVLGLTGGWSADPAGGRPVVRGGYARSRESAGTRRRLALSSSKSAQKAPRTSSRCSRERTV